MICPFNHEPCEFFRCPTWSERLQDCRWNILLNRILTEEKPLPELTAKEQSVLELMTNGYSNPQIANTLSIETQTVKNHVSNILRKLGAKSRLQAVILNITSKVTVPQY